MELNLPLWLYYVLGFPLLLGPLITIHELGHYLVGRWFGVHAEAFSVGFGKEIAGFTDRRGTRWNSLGDGEHISWRWEYSTTRLCTCATIRPKE